MIDYKEYEDKVRKVDAAYMQAILRKYVDHFKGRGKVLDIACGKGDFLMLAREAGVEAVGIDIDQSIVDFCVRNGLDVCRADAFEHLAGNPGAYGGVFCSQFIEHMGPDDLVRFLKLVNGSLREGGIFIATTPNPRSVITHLLSFYKDFSHVRLYDLELVMFLAEHAGFFVVESGYDRDTAYPTPAFQRLSPVITNGVVADRADDHLKGLAKTPGGSASPRPGNGAAAFNDDGKRLPPHYIDRLRPVRQKGILNGITYLADRVIFRLLRRYLIQISDDMGLIADKLRHDDAAFNDLAGLLYQPHDAYVVCKKA